MAGVGAAGVEVGVAVEGVAAGVEAVVVEDGRPAVAALRSSSSLPWVVAFS
jgi:hypothetical protein